MLNIKIQSITILARRWFDRPNGNTYFNGRIIVIKEGEKLTFDIPYQYGYGDNYLYVAASILEVEGIISPEHYNNGSSEPLWVYCDKKNIHLITDVVDVARKRDLY